MVGFRRYALDNDQDFSRLESSDRDQSDFRRKGGVGVRCARTHSTEDG